jgi:hypothetical protein
MPAPLHTKTKDPMTAYRHNDWNRLIGAFVEVRRNQEFFRSGLVDEAMPDSSALWLAADESHTRILIEAAEGYAVRVEPRALEGKLSYRMTTSALHP